MIQILQFFFRFFENFSHFFSFLALGVKKPPLGFDKGFDKVSQFFEMILFVFLLALFIWSAGQVEYVWVFHSVLWIVFQDLSCYIFTIQKIWIVLGRCLFLRSVHTFSWFLKSNWSSDFDHAETGSGAKKRVVLGVTFFRSKFQVEWENGVWTKIRFLASGFLFTCGNFTLIFTVFSIF